MPRAAIPAFSGRGIFFNYLATDNSDTTEFIDIQQILICEKDGGTARALFLTDYGQILMLKVAAFIAMLALAAARHFNCRAALAAV
jgi:hypothetical protein